MTPLTPETRTKLRLIGIVSNEWNILDEEDAIQVLAFHKFLNAATPTDLDDGKEVRRVMMVPNQKTYDYATGKINAKEYLDVSESEG